MLNKHLVIQKKLSAFGNKVLSNSTTSNIKVNIFNCLFTFCLNLTAN